MSERGRAETMSDATGPGRTMIRSTRASTIPALAVVDGGMAR